MSTWHIQKIYITRNPISNIISGMVPLPQWHLRLCWWCPSVTFFHSNGWYTSSSTWGRVSGWCFSMVSFDPASWSNESGVSFSWGKDLTKGSVVKDMVQNDLWRHFRIQKGHHFLNFHPTNESWFDFGVRFRWSAEDAENNCIFRYDLLGAQASLGRLEFHCQQINGKWVFLAIDPPWNYKGPLWPKLMCEMEGSHDG